MLRTLLRQRWIFKTPHPNSSNLVLNRASSPAQRCPAASGGDRGSTHCTAGWLSSRISLWCEQSGRHLGTSAAPPGFKPHLIQRCLKEATAELCRATKASAACNLPSRNTPPPRYRISSSYGHCGSHICFLPPDNHLQRAEHPHSPSKPQLSVLPRTRAQTLLASTGSAGSVDPGGLDVA